MSAINVFKMRNCLTFSAFCKTLCHLHCKMSQAGYNILLFPGPMLFITVYFPLHKPAQYMFPGGINLRRESQRKGHILIFTSPKCHKRPAHMSPPSVAKADILFPEWVSRVGMFAREVRCDRTSTCCRNVP